MVNKDLVVAIIGDAGELVTVLTGSVIDPDLLTHNHEWDNCTWVMCESYELYDDEGETMPTFPYEFIINHPLVGACNDHATTD